MKLMGLKLKRVICPYCGQWHDCEGTPEVRKHNSEASVLKLECSEVANGYYKGEYRILFEEDNILFATKELCQRGNPQIEGKVKFSQVVENGCITEEKPRFTFYEKFPVKMNIGNEVCHDCGFEFKCSFRNIGDICYERIKLGFEFE
ncbi:MAG: hypothetical protein HFJ55_00825 [Clostridia bacterium]|nr:hypothetical protein [Clostridia bacterium]